MLVNFSVRFQGQSNGFHTESISVTVTPDDMGIDELSRKNHAGVLADLTYEAVRACFTGAVLAGAMDNTTAKHRLKPFKRQRDKLCYGEGTEEEPETAD